MINRILLPALFLILGSAFNSFHPLDSQPYSFADSKTLILYDAATGNMPDSSLLLFTAFPSDAASLRYSNGATIMDTTVSGKDAYAGWVASQATTAGFPVLDRTTGVQVNFTLQVESEMHTSKNRSGFSVIVLDQEAKGVELSFWENEIWAQNDDHTGGLFKHGEGATFQTNMSLMDYQVTLTGETYTLTANSIPVLSGPIRDYSKFDGFPDPYETPNFLFLGDDTTASQARVRLRFVSVTGTESLAPTVAPTLASPTASLTPPPGATPLPLPTPARGFEFCSSGWLLMVLMIAIINKNIKR